MSGTDMIERDPDDIEAEIHRTRHSLGLKIDELERRLDPRHRWDDLRANFDSTPVLGWSAVAAIAAGTWMAIAGFRRYRFGAYRGALDDPMIADMMGE